MSLYELFEEMRRYNQHKAQGSECTEYGDFVNDCFERLGVAPWNDENQTIEVPDDMARYWLNIIEES